MKFKIRTRKIIIPWNHQLERRSEIQCPICDEWFDNYDKNNWVKHHITKMAQGEIWQMVNNNLNKKDCKHFNFFKKYTIFLRGKIIWKI